MRNIAAFRKQRSRSALLEQRPNLHVFMIGQDGTAYGNPRPDGKPWSVWARENFHFPENRIHWVGSISESHYQQILSISNIHYYLTVPFVLSWSFIEAMAVGIPIVASDTPPVREMCDHSKHALLVDFFDIKGQISAINNILDDTELSERLACNSKLKAKFYSCQATLDGWASVLGI